MLNNTVYDNNGNIFFGAGSGNVYAVSTTSSTNTFDDGEFYWVEIDNSGLVTNVGLQLCSGGGVPI